MNSGDLDGNDPDDLRYDYWTKLHLPPAKEAYQALQAAERKTITETAALELMKAAYDKAWRRGIRTR